MGFEVRFLILCESNRIALEIDRVIRRPIGKVHI
jgi:hypothetical protein